MAANICAEGQDRFSIYNQNMTVSVRATAARNAFAQWSQRIATLDAPLICANTISTLLQRLYRRLPCLPRDFRPRDP